ncbi:MAG TPA: DUF3267 domain-containing protein [Petrimonas sp.]|uniref:DUF3267 domain-containing protein n=1 Tax=Petrimonas sp. TaxID=2023866 RepID=UPI001758DD58|nr:DUF3267 domain-containing protein [Petrimonas sp.]
MFHESEYEKVLKTISIERASRVGLIITVPVFLIFTVPYVLIYDNGLSDLFEHFRNGISPAEIAIDFLLFTTAVVIGIVLHELIHGITWALFAKKRFKSIRFGVLWKLLTPYCHCTEPLKIKHYLLGAITPALFLGFVPGVAGIVVGSYPVTLFGIFFIIAAIGDFMIVHLLKNEKPDDYAQDHPSEAGCFVFRKKIRP